MNQGGKEMVSENPEVMVESAKDTTPVGNIDEETKKIYDQMKTQIAEVPAYIQLLKTGGLLERRKSAEFLG